MTHQRDLDALLRDWADAGVDHLPEHNLAAALVTVETTAQLRPRRSGPWLLSGLPPLAQSMVVGAAAVLLGLAVYAFLQRDVGVPEPSPTSSASPPSVPDARAVDVASTIDLGGRATTLRASDEALWAAVGSTIVRIDPRSAEASVAVDVPDLDTACAECRPPGLWSFDVDGQSAWVTYHREEQSVLRRFDLATGALLGEIELGTADGGGAGADDVRVAFGSVWVVMCHSMTVARIDPVTEQQVALIRMDLLSGFCPMLATIGSDAASVWVGVAEPTDGPPRGVVVAIDPERNDVSATIRPGALPCGRFASDATSVWVSSCPDSRVRVVQSFDRAQRAVAASVTLGGFAGDPVVHQGMVWLPVVDADDSFGSGPATLVGIDAASGQIADAVQLGVSIPVHGKTAAVALVAFDSLWVTGDDGVLLQIPLSELAP